MKELGFAPEEAMILHVDNKAAIDMSHNLVQHDRTKHVSVNRHFLKKNIDSKEIELEFVRSESQLADILTKGVTSNIFNGAISKLGMTDLYMPT